MYNWKHQVSRAWLEARKDILTATEARDLLSATKRFVGVKKPSLWTAPEFLGVIGKKSSSEVDVNSPSPEAARGHILEPYAVQEFNKYAATKHYKWPVMHHWDDSIVCDDVWKIGFSPDAMNIPQPDSCAKYIYTNGYITSEESNVPPPNAILEIKSYNAVNHMKHGYTRKTGLKERYQIAYAMLCCDTINEGFLMFYNPDNRTDSVFIKHYRREDLTKEINLMNLVVITYDWYKQELKLQHHYSSSLTEEMIWEIEQKKKKELNIFEEVI